MLLLVFGIAQQEDEVAALARLQRHLHIVRGDGAPAMSDTHSGLASRDALRLAEVVVKTYERLAVGIVTISLGIGQSIVGIVVAALLVFRLVVDGGRLDARSVKHRTLYFHLAGRKVTLEVLTVSSGIPQTPLRIAEQLQVLHLLAGVLQRDLLHFGPCL